MIEISPTFWILGLGVGITGLTVVLLLWFFYLKPLVEQPLPNEHDEGIWRMPLPQLGLINEGRVTTARRTIQGWWATLIDNADSNKRPDLIALRDAQLKLHLFAQKVGRDKYIYAFDKNPLDPEQHIRQDKTVRFGSDLAVRFIYNVKDCMNLGKSEDGFEFIVVKLSTESSFFTSEEQNKFSQILEGLKFLRLAAINTEASKHYKDLADDRGTLLEENYGVTRDVSSERDKAKRALSQKSLTEPETPTLKGGYLRAVAKGFFSGWQLFVTVSAYIITLNVAKYQQVEYPDPSTLAIIVAIFAFIVFPFIKGWLKR